jgi:hypothetical protein
MKMPINVNNNPFGMKDLAWLDLFVKILANVNLKRSTWEGSCAAEASSLSAANILRSRVAFGGERCGE